MLELVLRAGPTYIIIFLLYFSVISFADLFDSNSELHLEPGLDSPPFLTPRLNFSIPIFEEVFLEFDDSETSSLFLFLMKG